MKFQSYISLLLLLMLPSLAHYTTIAQTVSVLPEDSSFASQLSEPDFRRWLEKQADANLRFLWRKLNERGGFELEQAKLSSAENYFVKARFIAEKLDDKTLIAKSLHLLGKVTRAQGDTNKTRQFYEQAEELLRSQKGEDVKSGLGFLLQDSSNLFVLERQPAKALQAAYEAWQIADTASDTQLAALAANALGAAFRQRGNIISAVSWLEKSREIAAKAKNPDYFLLGDAALRLSYLYEAQGEYDLALQNLQTAERSFAELKQPTQNLRLWKALADFYNNHGQVNDAIRYLRQTCELAAKLDLTRRAVSCQTDLGLTYIWKKDFAEAKTFLRQAEDGALRIKAEDLLLKILVGKAVLSGQTGQFRQSLDIFTQAEGLAQTKGEWTDRLRIDWLKTVILFKQKNFPESLAAVERAISLAESHQETDSLAFLLELRGKILLARGQKKEARETLRRTIALIEQGRGQMNEAASSTGFLGERSESYRNLLELELEENHPTEALFVSDMLKSRWLADRSTAANPALLKNDSWQVSGEAKKLRRQVLTASEKLLENAPDAEKELVALEKHYQEKVDDSLAALSERFNLPIGDLENELASLVSDDKTAILSFAVTATDKIVVFVIQKKNIKAVQLSVGYSELAKRIRLFREEIASFAPNFKQTAKNLYRELLLPVEREISSVQKLIFVPDLGLWELPFQALINEAGQYTVEKYQISYLPSLRFLKSLRNAKTEQNKTFLAFGNSLTDTAKPLKEAEREVKTIGKFYPRSNIFVGKTAMEARFKQDAAKADLIHLAVHGAMNAKNPFDSALLMTKGGGEDGRLTVSEILRLPKLPNSLVVLSGCDTSNGQVLSGEGLLGLSWAFLAAGSRSVVAAQWAVEEKTTADLMLDFHRALISDDGRSAATALQSAQTEAIKQTAPFNHPFYWSAFVAVGADSQR